MNELAFAVAVFWVPIAFGLAGLGLYAMGRKGI